MGVKKIFTVFAFISLCALAVFSSYTDTTQRIESYTQNTEPANNQYSDILSKSINSAVRVISSSEHSDVSGVTASSTGTYFSHHQRLYVLTTAHSLVGDCDTTIVVADEYMFHCLEIVLYNSHKDYAIMEVEQIFNRIPIKINDFLYDEKETKYNMRVHEKIFYTGYPQALGPLTFDGKIVSHKQDNGIFYANSYAWAGSSGSGVFNSKGSIVGIITAVSVANTEYGVDVMEDLIIITPLNIMDILGTL